MTGSELLSASVLDAIVGDPRWLPHPVRGMGLLIDGYERTIRNVCRTPRSLRLAGVAVALGLPGLVLGGTVLVIGGATALSEWLGTATSIGLAFTTLAGRDLWNHTRAVRRWLETGNLPEARQALSLIVGRDTETLDEQDIARATVESLAESTADGVVAPLVYLSVGGAPLALAYKAINTLDSMIGHRETGYLDFGWAAARLDDAANWFPARLAAGLMTIAAGIATGQGTAVNASWRILRRDGHKHPSPNSGRPEAAMAGALGVQLGGLNYYDGAPHERPALGDPINPLTVREIDVANRIMVITCFLGLGLAMGSLWLR